MVIIVIRKRRANKILFKKYEKGNILNYMYPISYFSNKTLFALPIYIYIYIYIRDNWIMLKLISKK